MSRESSRLEERPRPARPSWLKVRMRQGEDFQHVEAVLSALHVNTVCRQAACPNIGTCFNERTATFLILGERCSRSCRFCNVKHGRPVPWDATEPERVAQAVKEMELKHVVVTSVTRDDLADGGANAFAETIAAIKRVLSKTSVEVLVPDFGGSQHAVRTVLEAAPDIVGHNIETVPRLYPGVRPEGGYCRSLSLLKSAKAMSSVVTKSGLMVGLGETASEVLNVLNDLSEVRCDIVTIGQYLAPTRRNLPVEKYYTPQEFEVFRRKGRERGIKWVESGPLVRSSLHARKQWQSLLNSACGS